MWGIQPSARAHAALTVLAGRHDAIAAHCGATGVFASHDRIDMTGRFCRTAQCAPAAVTFLCHSVLLGQLDFPDGTGRGSCPIPSRGSGSTDPWCSLPNLLPLVLAA